MNGPAVTALKTAVYVIPTDEPEADAERYRRSREECACGDDLSTRQSV